MLMRKVRFVTMSVMMVATLIAIVVLYVED